MEGYNSKQKLYIFIAVAIFIIINLLALVFALPFLNKGSVKGIYTDSLNESVFVDGNIEKPFEIETNKDISNNSKSSYIKNINYSFIALPQSNFNIKDFNTIKVTSGIYYFETQNELNINKDLTFTIANASRVIFDSDEGNIYVLKGSIVLLDTTLNAGYVVNINAKELSSNLIDKGQLLSTNKVKEINKILASKSLFIPELNFNSIPELELKDNLTEITTSYPSSVIEGTVSSSSKVYINKKEATILEDGTFKMVVSLKEGINDFKLDVVDEVANTLSTNIKIVFNK